MRDWFSVRLKSEGEKKETVAELSIFDFIGDWLDDYWGFGVTAKSFIAQIDALPASVDTVKVHINSPGGDVFAALAIANALRLQRAKGRTVETIVDGLAASAATLITMAGSPARMADNAVFMIHNPWSVSVGNAEEMRKAADTLDKIREALVSTYQWHATELSADDIVELMDAETWMDAKEAKEWGFIDEIDEGLAVAASLDPRAVGKLSIPERFTAQVKAFLRAEDAPAIEPAPVAPEIPEEPKAEPEPAPEPPADPSEVVAACAAAGIDVRAVASMVASRPTMAQALAGIERLTAERVEAQDRADKIRAACSLSNLTELAEPMVGLGCDLPAVNALLVRLRASLDKIELDSTLEPDHGAKRKPVIDTVAIYAERNGLRKLEK